MLNEIRNKVNKHQVVLIQIGDAVKQEIKDISGEYDLKEITTLYGKPCVYIQGIDGYNVFWRDKWQTG